MRLCAVIGNKVQLFREACGRTQDEVAAAARRAGLAWVRSSVAQLEAGTKNLSADELVLMPFVFRYAFDAEVDLAALVVPMDIDPPGRWIELGNGPVRVSYGALSDLLNGVSPDRLNPTDLDLPEQREQKRADAEQRERLKDYRRHYWSTAPVWLWPAAEVDAHAEATQKAARRLGVPAIHVAMLAHHLWGRGLTAERDARVAATLEPGTDPRKVQAARGSATRVLLDELRPLLKEDDD